MKTWLEEVQIGCAEEQRARAVQREVDAQKELNKAREITKRNQPLEVQIENMFRSLPPALRNRPWSMEELVSRLQGRYRDRPHAQHVGIALRKLSWRRVRLYQEYGGVRLWIPPQSF